MEPQSRLPQERHETFISLNPKQTLNPKPRLLGVSPWQNQISSSFRVCVLLSLSLWEGWGVGRWSCSTKRASAFSIASLQPRPLCDPPKRKQVDKKPGCFRAFSGFGEFGGHLRSAPGSHLDSCQQVLGLCTFRYGEYSNHNVVRVWRAYADQGIHAQTTLTLAFRENTITRASMPKPY